MSTYVPDWPPLNPLKLLWPGRRRALPFPLSAPHQTFGYVCRNVIFHLFRALGLPPGAVVLMPEYHSGVEVWAVRAAGVAVRFYRINRRLAPDLDQIRRLAASTNARVLYAIHFDGFPQPIDDFAEICRERDLILLEDCALAMLSEPHGRPLGSVGDYAVYCLYKTLPVVHGGLLVQNRRVIPALDDLQFEPCSTASMAGRAAELMLEWTRGRSNAIGRPLAALKRGFGAALSARGVARLPVGDINPDFSSIGFELDRMNVGMSRICRRLMASMDCESARMARRRNFFGLRDRLGDRVAPLRDRLDDGVCPLFFPLLVHDKPGAYAALRARNVGAVGFWNYGHPEAAGVESADTRFLRAHVLELPIHQDLTSAQLDYMADQILDLRISSPDLLA